MLINTPNLLALRTSFRTEFQNALQSDAAKEAQMLLEKIATTVPSSTASNTYGWLGQYPRFREWIGDRLMKNMQAHSYEIENKDWESSIDVLRKDIEDDNIGVYKPLFSDMGQAAMTHAPELVCGLLKEGANTPCFDGQNFFDAHPVFANTDGTGASTMVSNVTAGSGPGWYLLDTSRALKPMIFQQRKAPVFTSMVNLEDESVFMRNMFRFGVDTRDNAGFGFWQQAYMSQAELTDANFNAAYAAMSSLKADGGRPLGIRPTVLVVPPQLREAGLLITKAAYRNATTNVNAGVVELLVSPWIM